MPLDLNQEAGFQFPEHYTRDRLAGMKFHLLRCTWILAAHHQAGRSIRGHIISAPLPAPSSHIVENGIHALHVFCGFSFPRSLVPLHVQGTPYPPGGEGNLTQEATAGFGGLENISASAMVKRLSLRRRAFAARSCETRVLLAQTSRSKDVLRA